ncbi:MAG: hypothetical protein AAGF11_47410 [Myxococcota bacterium]
MATIEVIYTGSCEDGHQASSATHPDDALIWTFGTADKSSDALAELSRVTETTPDAGADTEFDPLRAAERLRERLATAPMPTHYFEGTSVAAMVDGIVALSQTRGIRPRKIVFEDHGILGLLFMGQDAVTTHTLPSFQRDLARLSECFVSTTEIYLLHCFAFADEGVLARELSAVLGCPIYGGVWAQAIGNQAYEGPVRRATADEVVCVDKLSLSDAVLHFD